ncbi:pilus assembly protein [Rhodobacterales bacterium HKCCE4037]|nr:pilus assembly protein [Rhodobacterales bacterium HKCCE4037]
MTGPLFRRFARDERAAVAVEFVLIAPVLLALLFGIVILGYFMGISHSVSQLAAGAARASVAGLDEAERRSIATAYLDRAEERYPLLTNEALRSNLRFDYGADAGITVDVSFNAEGTMLEIANGFLGLNIATIDGSAYLAY